MTSSTPRLSVSITLDFDALSVWIGSHQSNNPAQISRGEFGQVGAERLLALLHERGLPSTWFIPGHTADAFPATIEAIAAAGHYETLRRGACAAARRVDPAAHARALLALLQRAAGSRAAAVGG